ncbi:hypothetical protein NW767_015722 [Fusarium falciforme]|nr:hypothetical protein NW767_015722 [Fusarium falciforme]KAJ4213141.1 hypothetical protein NW757_014761 [Fusarium falciforme]
MGDTVSGGNDVRQLGATPRPATAETLPPYGSDTRPNGMAKILGVRPGSMFPYPEATCQFNSTTEVQIETTHDAIAQFLPSPLQVNRDGPPHVIVKYMNVGANLAFDGRPIFYHTVALEFPCRHGDVVGSYGWDVEAKRLIVCGLSYI